MLISDATVMIPHSPSEYITGIFYLLLCPLFPELNVSILRISLCDHLLKRRCFVRTIRRNSEREELTRVVIQKNAHSGIEGTVDHCRFILCKYYNCTKKEYQGINWTHRCCSSNKLNCKLLGSLQIDISGSFKLLCNAKLPQSVHFCE